MWEFTASQCEAIMDYMLDSAVDPSCPRCDVGTFEVVPGYLCHRAAPLDRLDQSANYTLTAIALSCSNCRYLSQHLLPQAGIPGL